MRISRERLYMDIADTFSRRSTCLRKNVGAVAVNVDTWSIMGTGYNGPPSGQSHCDETCMYASEKGCTRSIHAEVNALNRMGSIFGRVHLFVTLSPCVDCARLISNDLRVQRVYFEQLYRDQAGLVLLQEASIEVFSVLPNGGILPYVYKG